MGGGCVVVYTEYKQGDFDSKCHTKICILLNTMAVIDKSRPMPRYLIVLRPQVCPSRHVEYSLRWANADMSKIPHVAIGRWSGR